MSSIPLEVMVCSPRVTTWPADGDIVVICGSRQIHAIAGAGLVGVAALEAQGDGGRPAGTVTLMMSLPPERGPGRWRR
jgi:hypothetical protein